MCLTGPHDGKIYASLNPAFEVAISQPVEVALARRVENGEPTYQMFTYQWRQLTDCHGVWVPPDWDMKRIVGHMIEHYGKTLDASVS